MTYGCRYVSLFWKEFANLKTKTMAAERIASVRSRDSPQPSVVTNPNPYLNPNLTPTLTQP